MNAVESCPAHRYDDDVICLLDSLADEDPAPRQEPQTVPWTFICLRCFRSMLDAEAPTPRRYWRRAGPDEEVKWR